jgi:hypothetical protein
MQLAKNSELIQRLAEHVEAAVAPADCHCADGGGGTSSPATLPRPERKILLEQALAASVSRRG